MQYGMNHMDPKAQKRFDNDKIRAKQGTMLSDAARSSLRTKSQPVRQAVPQQPQQPQQAIQLPSAQAPSSQAMMGGLDSLMAGSVPDLSETIQNNMDLERLLSSPNIQQLYTRSRLRKYFKRNDPNSTLTDIGTDAVNDLITNM